MSDIKRKHYIRLLARLSYLGLIRQSDCSRLVDKSYDTISGDYDQSWTNHMRDLTDALLMPLNVPANAACLDLACGTGYATAQLAAKTTGRVVGVDRSAGMLTCARARHGSRCEFVQSDILEYLTTCPANAFDLVTCCWGLGYSRPLKVLCQIKRILRPGGQVAIIDNSLFSLREILYCSFLTFAEQPGELANLMRFRFLPNSRAAACLMRLAGLKVGQRTDGQKAYTVASGQAAIERLHITGAAAGFEYAATDAVQEQIFARFAEIIEQKYRTERGIDIIHRYYTITGKK